MKKTGRDNEKTPGYISFKKREFSAKIALSFYLSLLIIIRISVLANNNFFSL